MTRSGGRSASPVRGFLQPRTGRHGNDLPAPHIRWQSHLWPLLLVLPSVLLASWVIVAWKFNGLYGQDPFAYYDFGVGPLRHSVLDGAPLTAMFWPLGYPILITLTSIVVGPVPASGQIVNVVAAGAAVWLTYLLGRDLLLQAGVAPRRAHRAGALGAALLGVTGRFVESSVLIMADSVALATSLLSAWALVQWCARQDENHPQTGWLALSATALAWSVITRWEQALLFLIWLAVVAPTFWMRRRSALWWRVVGWAILPAAIVLGAQLFLVFTVRPVANLGAIPFAGDLVHLDGGAGWSLTHLFQHRFTNEDGVQAYPSPNALYYAAGAFLPQYFTSLILPFFIAGAIIAATMYRRLLLLLVWPVLLLFFDAGLDQQNPRYIVAVLPPVAIFVGLGAIVLWERLAPHWQPVGLVLIFAGLVSVAAVGLSGIGTLSQEQTADSQVASWTAASEPAGAITLSFGITLTLQHETGLHVLDLSVLTKPFLERLVAHRRPLYLLVRVGAMDRQFAARTPGINYRFLRDNPGLKRLGELHGYTLARVNAS